MNSNKQFEKSSQDFKMWLSMLVGATDDIIPQVQKLLDDTEEHPMGAPTKEQGAELLLRDIRKKIIDVLGAYDNMLESINMTPDFESVYK